MPPSTPQHHASVPPPASTMAAVPQNTLNWLYGVLTKDHFDPRQTYHDPNRTYHDIASALAQYPSLAPRTDVYTYENGFSALLLHLTGTLPVSFRGAVYKFPVALWIPNTYPREPPIVYVTPTQDMAVRVGQHVTLEGRVYHHYLAHWTDAWDRSSILDLLSILREVFAKEPPVKYKQQQQQMQRPDPVQAPPPVPPLPPELGPSRAQPVPSPQPVQMPPPPPPKPGQEPPAQSPVVHDAPARPPLPPKQDSRGVSYTSEGNVALENRMSPYGPRPGGWVEGHRQSYQQPMPQVHPQTQSQAYPTGPVSPVAQSIPGHDQIPRVPQQTGYYEQERPPYQTPQPQPQTIPPQQPKPMPKPAPDLLTSPFEVELPSITTSSAPPPIPPNPQKDALLHAVSKSLTETLHSNITQSESASAALTAQSHSLTTAISTLRTEITSITALNSTLDSNTSILSTSLHRADSVIADAQSRSTATSSVPQGLPPIDEVLVAPNVTGKQLYDLVSEESGLQNAIYALQAALVKGVISVDVWSRLTRGLAREAFLKRALGRKIARGMGLDV